MYRLFLISALVGFIITYLILPAKMGGSPKFGSNLIMLANPSKNNNECLHIHHWIIFTILISLILLVTKLSRGKLTPSIIMIIGFLFGSSLFDIVNYSDWNRIRINCY